ncbi:hypothetical protein L6R53_01220 [Myxococcota bacterium]|nr:hypothetical protein [Myxococcota bacterium]
MLRRLAPGALFSLSLVVAPFSACGDKDPGGGDGTVTDGGSADGGGVDGGTTGGTTDGGTGDGGTGDGGTDEPDPVLGTISGRVRVQLYDATTGDQVSWKEYGTTFPFGGIFVGAYQQEGRDAPLRYRGDTAITGPSADEAGDAYSLPVSLEEDGTVRVYAALDWNGDRVVGTDEPRGVWSAELEITEGALHEDIDLTIVAPVYVTGGGGCDTMSIAGDVVLTSTWVDGEVAAMTTWTDGSGPLYVTTATPTPDGGGASAPYTLTSCASLGEVNLVGAWDKNGNGLFEPTDLWGTYIAKPDVDGNPVSIGTGSLSGYDIQIPFGEGQGLSIVPFVTAAGTLGYSSGSLQDLPEGAVLHAMALKFRPEGEISVDEIEAYDHQVWQPEDYAGLDSVEWELLVPANSVTFLWFYADIDADGVLNEHAEPVGSQGTDEDGRFPTGTTSTDGYNVTLLIVK